MRIFAITFLVISIAFLIGCSGSSEIMSPATPGKIIVNADAGPLGVLVEETDTNGAPVSGMGVMGIFQGQLNKSELTAELTPLRNGALDDALEMVDITNFLRLAPCIDCVKIRRVQLDADGHLVVTIGVKHPFPAGDPFKPISGKNRADLHVFNVEGTVIFADSTINMIFPGTGVNVGPRYLLNADGYSPYLDIVLDNIYTTAASVHPYVMHFDDYTSGNFNPASPTGFESVTNPPPSGNLVMAMGCDYDEKDYVFDIPDNQSTDFIYAVGCTYAVSAAGKALRFNPEFQVPQHNKKAASEVRVEIVANNLKAGNTSSSADLLLKVLDINHGVAVGAALNEMKADSSVSAILVEIPGVTSGVVNGSTVSTGGDGRDPGNPLTFNVTVQNEQGALEGTYTGLVKISDAYPVGTNESPLLNGMDGIKRVGPIENPLVGLYAIPEFATYTVFQISVEMGNTAPTAVLNPNGVSLCEGSGVLFDASGSSDLEDDSAMIPLNFEFDFDYDGVNFVSDTGAPSTTATAQSPIYNPPGPYTAAVRVTDSGGLSDIATSTVELGDDTPTSDSWTSAVTDPASIQNVRYFHTRDQLKEAEDERAWGLEGTAYGNGYVYLTFFTSNNSVYFTRSSDSGQTWDTPTSLVSGVTSCTGAAISAHDNEVFIIYSETIGSTVHLLKNTNSGEGTWSNYLIGDYADGTDISNIGIAVDPSDTNYVYAIMVRGETPTMFAGAYYERNWTGGSGTWTEQYILYSPQPHNGCQMDIGVNTDGALYVVHMSNVMLGMTRSDDHGVTFTPWNYPNNVIWTHNWGGEVDMCFDPTDVNVVYMIWSTMGTNPPYGYRTVRLAKSTNRANNFTEIQSNLIHVTDVNARQPAITVDAGGKLFISYAYQTAVNDFDIFVRASCDDGATFSSAYQFNTADDDGFDVDPELVISPSGGIVLTWTNNGYTDFWGGPFGNPDAQIVARHLR